MNDGKGKFPGSLGPYSKIPNVRNTFGDRVREMRVQWEWTQDRLAEEIGVSQKTVSRWELGKGTASLNSSALSGLVRISRISTEAWISGAGFEVPDPPLDIGGHKVPSLLRHRVTPLPDWGPGICLVDPDSEWSVQGLELFEAIERITEIYNTGGTAWLVIPSG